jgi:ABC-type glycerol-3-phosphate transport system permease component
MVIFTRAHSCLLSRIEPTFSHHFSNSILVSVSIHLISSVVSSLQTYQLNVFKVRISFVSICVTYWIEPKFLDFIILLFYILFTKYFNVFCHPVTVSNWNVRQATLFSRIHQLWIAFGLWDQVLNTYYYIKSNISCTSAYFNILDFI